MNMSTKTHPSKLFSVLSGVPRTRVGCETESPASAPPFQIGMEIPSDDPVTLSREQRDSHLLALGGSGTGKSRFAELLIRRDLDDPECGLALIDPQGALYENTLDYITFHRPELAERVVLFDPNGDEVPGFNPLGGDLARSHPVFVRNMVVLSIMKAWQQSFTDYPRVTRWLENLVTLLVQNGLTLADAEFLLTTRRNSPHRRNLLPAVTEFPVAEDILSLEELTGTVRDNLLEGAINRLRRIVANDRLKLVMGRVQGAIDLNEVVNGRKILLVNLRNSADLDEESSRLLGCLLLHEIFRVADARNERDNPSPFYVYVDEFSEMVTPEIARALDQFRKYNVFTRLFGQHLHQTLKVDPQLFYSVLSNCRSKAIFATDYEDAEILGRQLHTDAEKDLHQIRHEQESVRFRPVEVESVTRTFGSGVSGSRSQSRGTGLTATKSSGRALGRSRQASRGTGGSVSTGISETKGTGEGHSSARQLGNSRSRSAGSGENHAVNVSRGKTVGSGTSESTSHSSNEQKSNGFSGGQGGSVQLSYPGGGSPGYQYARNTQRGASSTSATGQSDANSLSHSRQESESEQLGKSDSVSRNVTDSSGESQSHTRTENRSVQHTESIQTGRQQSFTESISQGSSVTESVSEAFGIQFSESESESVSGSRNASVTVGVRNQMEEFRETRTEFYGLQDIRHIQTCAIMDQPVRTVTLRFMGDITRRIRVDTVTLPKLAPRHHDWHRRALLKDIRDASPGRYVTAENARLKINQRHQEVFQIAPSATLSPGKEKSGNAEKTGPAKSGRPHREADGRKPKKRSKWSKRRAGDDAPEVSP